MFKRKFGQKKFSIIIVPNGEKGKNLENARKIWKKLLKHPAEKSDILIGLGGGSITDLTAFCASVYKRGMRCVLIPTTLLGMIDAAIGGKTGINLLDSKNQLGTFFIPDAIIILPDFLQTLPASEMRNGLAEMFKIALMCDAGFWNKLTKNYYQKNILNCIKKSVELKCKVVEKDFTEKNYRKILNFGHTFGHALESISLTKKRQNLSHGMAVTQGMILETFLSFLYGKIQETHMMDIIHELDKHLHPPPLRVQAEELFHYMKQDKKNKQGKILSVGISEPGKPCLDIEVSKKDIQQCIKMYHAWKKPFN